MIHDILNIVGGNLPEKSEILKDRRKKLINLIIQKYPNKKGSIFLFSPFEHDNLSFVQESSFYYFSGISEAASVLELSLQDESTFYLPHFGPLRAQWIHSQDLINDQTLPLFNIDTLKVTGDLLPSFHVDPYFLPEEYRNIIDKLHKMVQAQQFVFTIYPQHKRQYFAVKQIVDRLSLFVPGLMNYIVDISDQVALLRRKKDMSEIEQMYQACEITSAGFFAASRLIKPGACEAEIQAAIEYIFTENGAGKAYSSIVATGNNATILHYSTNLGILKDSDLLLIDAGAKFQNYCADITRVFPVSGKFSKKQQELYEIVLQTQELVAKHARPGVWISNEKEQEASLYHIAINYLKKHGYDKYFIHGIGHFLGLDVHDVGQRNNPLEEGDVITIEPGVYIPEKSIGIRIEDNYWILKDSEPICLSDSIPKSIDDVEKMVQDRFDVDLG